MGNGIGAVKKRAKVMKIDGETFKVKAATAAADVLKDYPAGYVLLESEKVKKHGIRAQQLRPEEELKAGKIYFLVEMPKFPTTERLEGLRLRHKSAVDMGSGSGSGSVRVKMRLPRAQIEKLMRESKDEAEMGHRILQFYLHNTPTTTV